MFLIREIIVACSQRAVLRTGREETGILELCDFFSQVAIFLLFIKKDVSLHKMSTGFCLLSHADIPATDFHLPAHVSPAAILA